MIPKKWFKSKKPWLSGGIIGLIICLLLLLFNFFIYFPIVDYFYKGMLPFWATLLPMLTGHAFLLFAHFVIPYGWLCERTEAICTNWTVEMVPDCIPETFQGVSGCCLNQSMFPADKCANLSEVVGFSAIVIVLFSVYFIIGAVIGTIIQKRKKR